MKAEWRTWTFDEAVEDASGGNIKTPQGEYLPKGELPIVDQGEKLVGGYSNELAAACRASLPVVVFGDHTRRLKYVDFSFGMGADGVKVLSPRVGIDAKYLYHYLRSLALPAAGYDRHFKYLKRVSITAPPLPEQRRIAEVLDRAETLRSQRRQALAQLGALAESIFLDMFGDFESNARGWPIKALEELNDTGRPIGYGILMPGPDQPDGVPYVRVVDMKNGEINVSGVRRTTLEINHQYRRSTLRTGDLLISIRGHVGRMARVPAELDAANITQDSARIAPAGVDVTYLLAALRSAASQRWMQRRTRGVAVQGLNIGDLRLLPVPLPPRKLQEQFARRINVVDQMRQIGRVQTLQLNALFASLQHRAFRGEL